jgi:cobalt-zinc-cadmium resistance protein CzcA
MAPISTGLGEIYQYVVFQKPGFEDKYNAMDLRTVQDWIIKPQLIGTKGVAEVNTLGGLLKQYEIAVQPDKLRSMNTTMPEILEALEHNNENTGGAYIDKKPNAYFIRGIGMVNGIDDIQKIVVKNQNGIPILVRDVATVQFGSSIRYGATTKDGKGEAVSGMVMMLKGANSARSSAGSRKKWSKSENPCPKAWTWSRSSTAPNWSKTPSARSRPTCWKVRSSSFSSLFYCLATAGGFGRGLGHPAFLLFAVSMMNLFGVSGNLMSLGAIDFGLIVDGAVIIVEAIVHRLQH